MKKLLLYTLLATGFVGLLPLHAMEESRAASASPSPSSNTFNKPSGLKNSAQAGIFNGVAAGFSDLCAKAIGMALPGLVTHLFDRYVVGQKQPATPVAPTEEIAARLTERSRLLTLQYNEICVGQSDALSREQLAQCVELRTQMIAMVAAATNLQIRAINAEIQKNA